MTRGAPLALIALIGLPAAASAQEACGPLKIVNIVRMIPTLTGDADIVPVVLGGKPRRFLLDTGGYYSQISRPLANELGLTIRQGRSQLFDVTGNLSQDQVVVPQLTVGEITEPDARMMVSPSQTDGLDGILAADRLAKYDAELDFSTDTLNLFSPDHCPGHVVYWTAPAVAVVPITLQRSRPSPLSRLEGGSEPIGLHILVPVTLDGHEIKALIDTGAATTSLRMDDATHMYGLTLGSPDTPEKNNLNGDASLKTYSHLFKSLSFGAVTVENARLTIIPNAMGRNIIPTQLVGDRTKTERDLVNTPELIIGMDVLRRLRIYFAFREEKMYISPSSAPPVGTLAQTYSREFLTAMLARLDSLVAAGPGDASVLNDRCFWRGIAKTDLDGALADCDKSLTLEPGTAATLDSRAFVLFQQGKYQDALAGYNAALAADPHLAPALLMRGYTRGMLGDASGKEADLASAQAADPNVQAEFKRIGVSE
jgi:predicted aspartyl protease